MRPFTRWAATEIERCLERNDDRGKPPWETAPLSTLMEKLKEEMTEVDEAVVSGDSRQVIDECFDLAATAAMIASQYDFEMVCLKRGFLP